MSEPSGTVVPDLVAIRAEHRNVPAKATSARLYCEKCRERMPCKVLALCDALEAQAERLAREKDEHEAFRRRVRDVFWQAKIPAHLLINDLEILDKIRDNLADLVAARDRIQQQSEDLGRSVEAIDAAHAQFHEIEAERDQARAEAAALWPVVEATKQFVSAEHEWVTKGLSRGSARIADETAANLQAALAALVPPPEGRQTTVHPDDCECPPCWRRGNYVSGVDER